MRKRYEERIEHCASEFRLERRLIEHEVLSLRQQLCTLGLEKDGLLRDKKIAEEREESSRAELHWTQRELQRVIMTTGDTEVELRQIKEKMLIQRSSHQLHLDLLQQRCSDADSEVQKVRRESAELGIEVQREAALKKDFLCKNQELKAALKECRQKLAEEQGRLKAAEDNAQRLEAASEHCKRKLAQSRDQLAATSSLVQALQSEKQLFQAQQQVLERRLQVSEAKVVQLRGENRRLTEAGPNVSEDHCFKKVAKLELQNWDQVPLDERKSLRVRLELKWHPDKQVRCSNSDMARRVFQELHAIMLR